MELTHTIITIAVMHLGIAMVVSCARMPPSARISHHHHLHPVLVRYITDGY